MVATVTPEQLGKRVLDYTRLLSYGGMSAACQSALRPARKLANTKNFGFTDRTGDTRKKLGQSVVIRFQPPGVNTAAALISGAARFLQARFWSIVSGVGISIYRRRWIKPDPNN